MFNLKEKFDKFMSDTRGQINAVYAAVVVVVGIIAVVALLNTTSNLIPANVLTIVNLFAIFLAIGGLLAVLGLSIGGRR
jgi:hypothetical protein